MKRIYFIAISVILYACAGNYPDGESQFQPFAPDGIPFTIADSAWNVNMAGSQRAVVEVDAGGQNAVKVTLPWRRPDMRPETKKIAIFDAKTGQEIKNVSVIDFSSEKGVIAFQPLTIPGTYYIYYLPARFREKWGDARYGRPWNDYLSPEYTTDPDWEKDVKTTFNAIREAKVVRFEARSKFDFFTSMGLIATEKEIHDLKQNDAGDFMLFPEDLAYPIRLSTIPARWAKVRNTGKFKGFALPNEYYT